MIPRATYRLQLSKDFDFDQAAKLAAYLSSLGISHLYASPWLTARPGSAHGYDLIDPGRINPEFGGEAGFARLSEELRKQQLGHILDFIPNHMGVGGADNVYWLDVLEWGEDSLYADWFDIDWRPDPLGGPNKVLVPFLGNQYGIELQKGALKLVFDESAGGFAFWAYDTHKLPVCPIHYGRLLGTQHSELERLGDAFAHLPPRYRMPKAADLLKADLVKAVQANADLLEEFRRNLASLTWKDLDELIQLQYWRPAHFRVASDDINYRRFFNVNELARIRMEHSDVFQHAHRLVFDLIKAGDLQGLRIDHIDGLYDPKEYLDRLRASLNSASREEPPFLVVEKILAPHEGLREEWPVDGTTGYEFGSQVLGALLNPAGEEPLTRTYRQFTVNGIDFAAILRASKLQIIENEMAGELATLAQEAVALARQNPCTADFTQNVFQRALKQIVACFPVYRTYIDQRGAPSTEDRRDLDWAVQQARTYEIEIDPSVFDFLSRLLSGELTESPQSGYSRADAVRWAMRFQQYTVPVMAKGLEDTAFYRYVRLFALNEVGSRPEQFGLSLSSFHKANAARQKRWPNTLLGTSTHDTKLGEDARARLAVLPEIADEWEHQVKAWTRILRAGIGGVEGDAPPARNDEYLFYQFLVASWPAELTLPNELDTELLGAYVQRLSAAMIKGIREAKTRTTWVAPNANYEKAVSDFVERALDPERSQTFLGQFRPFQERVARLGVENSLFQTMVKLTAPGVPDIYQGSELWNLNLMDPDNRRSVDFSLRQDLLAQVSSRTPTLQEWHSGAIKMHVIAALLRFRREHPQLFSEGQYQPLAVTGSLADSVFAYARRWNSESALVLCGRFPAMREIAGSWGDTALEMNGDGSVAEWSDLLTGTTVPVKSGRLLAADALRSLPVAVLIANRVP